MSPQKLTESFLSGLAKLFAKELGDFLATQSSFFALPIVNQITIIILERVFSLGLKYTSLAAYFGKVDLSVGKQAEEFKKAAEANQQAQLSANKKEQEKAEQDLINSARDLIKFGKI